MLKAYPLILFCQTTTKVIRGVCKKIYVSQDFPLMPAPERKVQACLTLPPPRSPPTLNEKQQAEIRTTVSGTVQFSAFIKQLI